MGSKQRKTSTTSTSLLLLTVLSVCAIGVGASSAASISIIGEKEKIVVSSCNGTFGLGDCFSSDRDDGGFGIEGGPGDELLRHYAAGARWLLQAGTPTGQRALQPPPVCNTRQYSNCLPRNAGGTTRTCANYNKCKRAA